MAIKIDAPLEYDPLHEMFVNAVLQCFPPDTDIEIVSRDGYYLASIELPEKDIYFGSTRHLLEQATEEEVFEDVKSAIEEMIQDPRFE